MKNENIILLKKGASVEIENDGFNINRISEIEKWLKLRNVLKETEILLKYKDIKAWKRSGAETYFTIFNIIYKGQIGQLEKNIVIKALVSFFPEKSLLDWKRRRQLLQRNEIPVSKWYYADKGIIIEDFYIDSISQNSNFDVLFEIAIILDRVGFNPNNFLRDLRSDEKGGIFYVDFGFDLGEPNGKPNHMSSNILNNFINNR